MSVHYPYYVLDPTRRASISIHKTPLRFADKFREVLLPTGMCHDGIQPMEVAKLASRWAVATAKVEEGGVDSFNERLTGVTESARACSYYSN